VVDHRTHEVLAWVSGGRASQTDGSSWIDAITTPRQPGSTLKPFLYALALEKGWTAATRVDDTPLDEAVGLGLHTYHNYSRTHYGPVLVRDALGNSLNIPAVRTIQFVGVEPFLECLRAVGISSLNQHPSYYGHGLALGNGEITLLELVRAYAVLAQGGVYHPFRFVMDLDFRGEPPSMVFSPETSSIIASILSDPDARTLEFGQGGLLRFPIQTAIKTGTSSDYRDAWTVGFDDRYVVGVWMGNLAGSPMDGITGSIGPALVLRSVFAELNRNRDTRPLYLSPWLVQVEICRDTGRPFDGDCPSRSEWFAPGTEPHPSDRVVVERQPCRLVRPTEGLQLAMDPRIPDNREAFSFSVSEYPELRKVEWVVDGRLAEVTQGGDHESLWPLEKGVHVAQARGWTADGSEPMVTPVIRFIVK
jgi:penicillin-binding protein 1C